MPLSFAEEGRGGGEDEEVGFARGVSLSQSRDDLGKCRGVAEEEAWPDEEEKEEEEGALKRLLGGGIILEEEEEDDEEAEDAANSGVAAAEDADLDDDADFE